MDIMEGAAAGKLLEIAVTWVNLAVLYEKAGRRRRSTDVWKRQWRSFALERFPETDITRLIAGNARKHSDISDISE